MSQLVQMRSRIQTIETIKKVTDAMRIISMSSHSRLKTHQDPLNNYRTAIEKLFAKIYSMYPNWSSEQFINNETDDNPLIILIGSQKGLCGGFNTFLSKYFSQYLSEHASKKYRYIAVGKKAIDYLQHTHPHSIVHSFETLTAHNYLTIAHELTHLILTAKNRYTSVTVFSNVFKNFFVQKPTTTHLLPFKPTPNTVATNAHKEEYLWDDEPTKTLDNLFVHYIEAQLQYLIFESLLSEHASRFISMDNSTRNANSLLELTKLKYNKLRQTKITTEITELTSNF